MAMNWYEPIINLVSLLKKYLGKDAVYKVFNSIIESKYCSNVIKEF